METFADLVKIHYLYYNNPLNYKKFIPKDWTEIDDYTDIDSMVFEKGNDIVIAMRGLKFGNLRDMKIGADIITGDLLNPRGFDFETSRGKYKEILLREQQKIDKLKEKYPDKNIILAGHSRGGRKSIDLGMHNNLEFYGFNSGDASSLRDKIYSIALPYILGQIPMGEISEALGYTLNAPMMFAQDFLEDGGYEGMSPAGILNKFGMTTLTDLNKPILNAGLRAAGSVNPITTSSASLIQDVVQPLKNELISTTIGGGNPLKTLKYGFPDARLSGMEYSTQENTIKAMQGKGRIPLENVDDVMMSIRRRGRNVDGGWFDYDELKDYTGGIYAKQYNPEKKLVDQQSLFDGNSLIEIIQKGFSMAAQPLLPTQPIDKILSKGNLYSTERDIVSSGYKGSKLQNLIGVRPEIIENKDYVRDFDPTHHSIDHFISRELFDAIKNNNNFKVLDQDLYIPTRFEREGGTGAFETYIGNVGGTGREKLDINRFCQSYPYLEECRLIQNKKF